MQFIGCSHRYPRGSAVSLIVIHTNEGPEGPNSAEGLANYLARPDVIPGYHYVVDENSAVQCALTSERVNGAGGVNDKSVHICITGYAAQTSAQWHDAASLQSIAGAEAIARQTALTLGVPWVRVDDPRSEWGICGHVDVSRYFPASMGHTDPGPNFPWDEFMGTSPQPEPDPVRVEDMTEFFYRNPNTGAIFYFAGNHRAHVNSDQKALLTLAAALETPKRVIVDLGNLSPTQLAAMDRFPQVGSA